MSALDGKTIAITGVTSGIGEATVEAALAHGARVIGIGRDAAKLEACAARWGERFVAVRADLSSPEDRRRALETIAARADAIDALVNNAAEIVYASALELPLDDWRRLLEVNLLAPLDFVRALASRLPRGGHVVNVSSVTARFLPAPRFAPYAVTKAAVEHLTGALRLELDGRGVRVSMIVPGLVDTPAYDKVKNFEKARGKLREAIPEWLSAGDVAEAILWILERPARVVVSELVLMPQGQSR